VSNSSFSRRLNETKVDSINQSKYDQVEEHLRPLESYKHFIKIPSPQRMEDTYKSVGQKLEEESNIYSPLGRNQVEHYNSRNDDTIDEIERY